MTDRPLILAYPQARALLAARAEGETAAMTSVDLNLTTVPAALDEDGVTFDDGRRVGWALLEEIAASDVNCFLVDDATAEKIVYFAESTNRVYSLMPTAAAPTMLISGIPMHRIKGTDPVKDTREKIKALRPRGRVLDTATGLGYTAIAAAQVADHVTTIEVEPTVLELCRLNPWSQELFDNPQITQLIGDTYELIRDFPAGAFDCILHDPPAFGIDGELYSGEVYRQFMRILRPARPALSLRGQSRQQVGRQRDPGCPAPAARSRVRTGDAPPPGLWRGRTETVREAQR